jgi:hypothetical protein
MLTSRLCQAVVVDSGHESLLVTWRGAAKGCQLHKDDGRGFLRKK